MGKKKILVISFSDISKDARVLRQLSVVKEFGKLTTLGYGPAPEHSNLHLRINSKLKSLPQTIPGVLKLAAHLHRFSEFAAPGLAAARTALKGRQFDLIVCNDARALPVAFYASKISNQAPVWVDLHEWAPEERTHVFSWRVLVAPYIRYLCQKYLPQTAAQTTVGTEIAKLYQEHFRVTPRLLRNCPRYQQLSAQMTEDEKIRLVHSGGAVPGRALEETIKAVLAADKRFSLDFYLVPANDGGKYLSELEALAAGSDRICFHEPVAPDQLPATLNQYDVGVFWIPPFNTNARLTLPNKLFDFIQARLAIAVGPTVEMQNIVQEHGLGVISAGYTVEQIVQSLNSLTKTTVNQYKQASNEAAKVLNFDHEATVIRQILQSLLGE